MVQAIFSKISKMVHLLSDTLVYSSVIKQYENSVILMYVTECY